MNVKLTNSTKLSQQLCPHAQYHVHGGLGQEVLLTKGSFPTITAGLLPCLTPHRKNMTENMLLTGERETTVCLYHDKMSHIWNNAFSDIMFLNRTSLFPSVLTSYYMSN